ncbi:MAG: hypothetical protein ACI9L9_001671 [Marivirga sp.]|jgi:hypothetical protein
MKKLRYILLLVFLGFNLIAQSQNARAKIESARIALINNRLDLTPDQAEKFWPIYREYSKKREGLKTEYRQARQRFKEEGMTEGESKKLLEIGLSLKEREVALEREYAQKLTTVISNKQLLALKKAEDDFRQMLIERLKERQGQQEQMKNRRLRNNY